jgi:hypothetical protein
MTAFCASMQADWRTTRTSTPPYAFRFFLSFAGEVVITVQTAA